MNSRIILIAAVVIVILGAGAFFLTQNNTTNNSTTTTTPTETMTMDDSTNPTEMMEESTNSGETMSEDMSDDEGTVKEVVVTGSNFKFSPTTITVNKGDTVKVTFKNTGGMHDFVIDEFDARTEVIQDGAEETISFVADQAGSFEFYCSVGSHRQMGMKGTLIVK